MALSKKYSNTKKNANNNYSQLTNKKLSTATDFEAAYNLAEINKYQASLPARKKQKRPPVETQRKIVAKFEKNKPKNNRTLARKYDKYKWFSNADLIKIPKNKINEYKERGYPVFGNKIAIEKIRSDFDGKLLPGQKVRILSNGTIKHTHRQRTTYTRGLNKKEKARLLYDDEKFLKSIIDGESRKRKIKGKVYYKLQYGAFATSGRVFDFNALSNYISNMRGSAKEKLTGIKIVVFNNAKDKKYAKKKRKVKNKK